MQERNQIRSEMQAEYLRLAEELVSIAEFHLGRYKAMGPLLREQPEEPAPEARWALCCVQIALELMKRAREVAG